MLQLKLKEPYDQVFIGLHLKNPLTGENTIVDAKIDTGAAVTLVPMSAVSNISLDVIGQSDFIAANGGGIHTHKHSPEYLYLKMMYLRFLSMYTNLSGKLLLSAWIFCNFAITLNGMKTMKKDTQSISK